MARILIIEDDNEVRDYLESVLSRAGYEVEAAANGKDGVEIFKRHPVDLVAILEATFDKLTPAAENGRKSRSEGASWDGRDELIPLVGQLVGTAQLHQPP